MQLENVKYQAVACPQLPRCLHRRHLFAGWFTGTGSSIIAMRFRIFVAIDSTSLSRANVFFTMTHDPSPNTITPWLSRAPYSSLIRMKYVAS